MSQLVESLQQFLAAGWDVLRSLFALVEPNLGVYLFLAAWIAFFLFAVNWVEFRRVWLSGGWVGMLLIALVTVLVWGSVAPSGEPHNIFGLSLSNYVGKTVYVTALICIMLVCGSIQLASFQHDDHEISTAEEAAPPAHH